MQKIKRLASRQLRKTRSTRRLRKLYLRILSSKLPLSFVTPWLTIFSDMELLSKGNSVCITKRRILMVVNHFIYLPSCTAVGVFPSPRTTTNNQPFWKLLTLSLLNLRNQERWTIAQMMDHPMTTTRALLTLLNVSENSK